MERDLLVEGNAGPAGEDGGEVDDVREDERRTGADGVGGRRGEGGRAVSGWEWGGGGGGCWAGGGGLWARVRRVGGRRERACGAGRARVRVDGDEGRSSVGRAEAAVREGGAVGLGVEEVVAGELCGRAAERAGCQRGGRPPRIGETARVTGSRTIFSGASPSRRGCRPCRTQSWSG